MTRRLDHLLHALRDAAVAVLPVLLFLLILLVALFKLADPMPPKVLNLATGPAQSTYAEMGEAYRRAMSAYGVEVQIEISEGSVSNIERLKKGEVDAAIVQSGVRAVDQDDRDQLDSLGMIFREPLWILYMEHTARERLGRPQLDLLTQMTGWTINIGSVGSSGRELMRQLLDLHKMNRQGQPTRSMALPEAASAFLYGGGIDAIAFVAPQNDPILHTLLHTPGVRILNMAQADAMSLRIPHLTTVRLQKGLADEAQLIPDQDITLLATTVSLVVREETHPALQQLLMMVATQIHSQPGWFQRYGEFPIGTPSIYHLSEEAEHFWRHGPPRHSTWLPYWLNAMFDRTWLALLAIVIVVVPVFRSVRRMLDFRLRSRVLRWYGPLRRIESDLLSRRKSPGDLQQALDQIERELNQIELPLSRTHEFYQIRMQVQRVRHHLIQSTRDQNHAAS
jgi:TRAP-type uncharacterized transport system substrate-binding protein